MVANYKVWKSLKIERQIEEARLRDDQHFGDRVKPASNLDSSQPLEAPHIDGATEQPEDVDAVRPHSADGHLSDHQSPQSIPEPFEALVASSVGTDPTSTLKAPQVDEERQRHDSLLPVAEKAVSNPVVPPLPSHEPVSPPHKEKKPKHSPVIRLWARSKREYQILCSPDFNLLLTIVIE